MSEYNRGMAVEDVVLETLKHLGCRSSGKLTKTNSCSRTRGEFDELQAKRINYFKEKDLVKSFFC